MKGYIAITSDSWCNNLREMHLAKGVFWRKRESFNALVPAEPYFFLNEEELMENVM